MLSIGGQTLRVRRPVVHKWVDPVQGERYRRVEVLPRVTLDPRGELLLFPDASPRPFSVTLRSVAGAAGTVSLEVPEGFSLAPASIPFQLPAGGETVVTFHVTPPRSAATGRLVASATVGGERFDRGVRRVDHGHIPIQTWLPVAEARLTRVDVLHSRHRIGYVQGPGDEVPDALRQAGYTVTLVTPQELRDQPLDRFDAIVFGIRAFNVSPLLATLHDPLMAYVKGGGTVVVQYLTHNWISNAPPDIGPFPFTIGRGRVTDEDAAVLTTASPVLSAPNRIEAADLDGMGPGARALLRGEVGRALRDPALHARPRREAAEGRAPRRGPREGRLRLHRALLLPPAARRRAGRVPALREHRRQ